MTDPTPLQTFADTHDEMVSKMLKTVHALCGGDISLMYGIITTAARYVEMSFVNQTFKSSDLINKKKAEEAAAEPEFPL